MVTIDLKDAYLHIPIFQEHQILLCFAQTKASNIVSSAPCPSVWGPAHESTKILAEVISHFHLQGIALIPYLDDKLVCKQSQDLLLSDLDKVIHALESLG